MYKGSGFPIGFRVVGSGLAVLGVGGGFVVSWGETNSPRENTATVSISGCCGARCIESLGQRSLSNWFRLGAHRKLKGLRKMFLGVF